MRYFNNSDNSKTKTEASTYKQVIIYHSTMIKMIKIRIKMIMLNKWKTFKTSTLMTLNHQIYRQVITPTTIFSTMMTRAHHILNKSCARAESTTVVKKSKTYLRTTRTIQTNWKVSMSMTSLITWIVKVCNLICLIQILILILSLRTKLMQIRSMNNWKCLRQCNFTMMMNKLSNLKTSISNRTSIWKVRNKCMMMKRISTLDILYSLNIWSRRMQKSQHNLDLEPLDIWTEGNLMDIIQRIAVKLKCPI